MPFHSLFTADLRASMLGQRTQQALFSMCGQWVGLRRVRRPQVLGPEVHVGREVVLGLLGGVHGGNPLLEDNIAVHKLRSDPGHQLLIKNLDIVGRIEPISPRGPDEGIDEPTSCRLRLRSPRTWSNPDVLSSSTPSWTHRQPWRPHTCHSACFRWGQQSKSFHQRKWRHD